MSGFLSKKKRILISTITFLIVQLVVLGAASWAIDSIRSSVYDINQSQVYAADNAFRIALKQQTLQLEGIKEYFFKEVKPDTDPVSILRDKVASTYNFTNARNIYIIERQTGIIIYPTGSGYPKTTEEMIQSSSNPEAMTLFFNELLKSQDFTYHEYLISLHNDSHVNYTDSYDFEKYPLGTLNRNFVQKIVLPRPALGTNDYIIATSFPESLINDLSSSTKADIAIDNLTQNTIYLIIIMGVVLLSAILFSIVNLSIMFQIYAKVR